MTKRKNIVSPPHVGDRANGRARVFSEEYKRSMVVLYSRLPQGKRGDFLRKEGLTWQLMNKWNGSLWTIRDEIRVLAEKCGFVVRDPKRPKS